MFGGLFGAVRSSFLRLLFMVSDLGRGSHGHVQSILVVVPDYFWPFSSLNEIYVDLLRIGERKSSLTFDEVYGKIH